MRRSTVTDSSLPPENSFYTVGGLLGRLDAAACMGLQRVLRDSQVEIHNQPADIIPLFLACRGESISGWVLGDKIPVTLPAIEGIASFAYPPQLHWRLGPMDAVSAR